MPKPILVTGATGSIGSELVKRLLNSGECVRVLVRNPQKAASLQDLGQIELFSADLNQPESLHGCADGCSLVYHCAAKLASPDWAGTYAVNVTGTQAVIAEAARAGVERLVYTSTIGVYGLSRAEIIGEETPWSAYHQPYFQTKQEAERLVERAKDQVPVAIARLGDVIGPGQTVWTTGPIQRMNRGAVFFSAGF